MNILSVEYTLQHKSLDIYIAGCKGANGNHCKECHNPESWDFNQGTPYDNNMYNKIRYKTILFDNLIDNIMIFGGEPNDSPADELLHFLVDMKSMNKKLWLFTRYYYHNLPKYELDICDYIKIGAYVPSLKCDDNVMYGIKLATSNQRILKKGLDY